MIEAISNFFNSEDFMPHGHCFLWQSDIFWLHLLSDSGIAAAYFAIPLALIYILRKRDDVPFENIFLLFAAFILFCGATHLMSLWVLWHPDYAAAGLLKAMTAIVSIATFFVIVKFIPRILSIPSSKQLAAVNRQLQEAGRELELLYQQSKANSESHLQAIVNTVLDGVITIDEKGTIQTFNPASVRIFGYRPEEVIGRNVKILMPEPYHSGHDGYLHNYLTTNHAKVIGIGREVAAKRKDGSVFPMELGINEMQQGGARMFVGTIRDISQRKEAEREIQQYLAALKRSNQELDDFAYIASHDLKEPLRGLNNNALFLKEDCKGRLAEENIRRLDRMTYLCERMERLVNDLLYFSRLGRQELAVQKTNLNAVIADIESMMETTLGEANATIRIIGVLPTITCDLPRITEVFRNLITNAVKYNDKPEKIVEIGYELQGGEHVFFVRDNGIGILSQFYDDVFRIFKRLNDEDDSVKGTGVGLTFVKKIVERHRGRIWIESEEGKGTTFYFTIQESGEES
jgi:PAS domain S-box-containing protein